MCTLLQVSRAAYYAWLKRSTKPDRDTERMKLVEKAFQASHHTYGYRRVQIWIQQKTGVTINHKTVLRLMNKLGIHSVARRRKFLRRAEDYGIFHRYPNTLKRVFFSVPPQSKMGHGCDLYSYPPRLGTRLFIIVKELWKNKMGIDKSTKIPDLKMQMGSGRISCVTSSSDSTALINTLSTCYTDSA